MKKKKAEPRASYNVRMNDTERAEFEALRRMIAKQYGAPLSAAQVFRMALTALREKYEGK